MLQYLFIKLLDLC